MSGLKPQLPDLLTSWLGVISPLQSHSCPRQMGRITVTAPAIGEVLGIPLVRNVLGCSLLLWPILQLSPHMSPVT